MNLCVAQKRYYLQFVTDEVAERPVQKILHARMLVDSLTALQQIQQKLVQLHRQSFIAASIDSIQFRQDTLYAFIYLGPAFHWIHLSKGNVEESILSEVGYRERVYQGRPFSERALSALEESILAYMDNRGYPFASIRTDSLIINENTLGGSLYLEKGPFIRFDTLALAGTAKLKPKFLATYLRMEPGQAFSQRKIERAARLLTQLPYITVSQPTAVVFKNDRAYPVIYADAKKTNEIDGIVGILPNEQSAGKVLITGELRLRLMNMFSSGKGFLLHWQQIRPASPRLDVMYEHPGILNTPLEMKVNFRLVKEDSSFVTVNRQFMLSYQLNNTGKVSISTGIQTSQLGSNSRYRNTMQLPEFSDSRWISYGIGYNWNNLDDYFYPSRGVEVSANALLGNKKIVKNPFVEPSAYENIPLVNMQWLVTGSIRKFTRISTRSTILLKASGGKIANNRLFLNDLFRLGGLNSLRGYNENLFFASDYGLATIEYRFFMDATSQFFLFYDQGYLEYTLQNQAFSDAPLGTGCGITLRTGAGLFSVVYALGHSSTQKFGLNYSRIHFGLTSRF